MKQGIAVWNYPGDALTNALAFQALGFDTISYLGRHFDAHDAAADERLACFLQQSGLTFTIHHAMPNPRDSVACAAFVKNMEHIAKWQDTWHLLTGLTFDFVYPHALSMDIFDAALRLFRGTGVYIACEDTPLNAGTYAHFEPLLTARDNFGILIDLGHMNVRHTLMELRGDKHWLEAFTRLPVPLKEIHISDNGGRKDEHAALGEGSLPLADVTAALRAVGFDGMATIERVPRDEDILFSRRRARQSMDLFLSQF